MPLYDMTCVKCKRTDEYLIRNPADDNPECRHCGGYLERDVAQKFNIGNSSRANSHESCDGLNRKYLEELAKGLPHPRYQHPGDKIVIKHSDGSTTIGEVLLKKGNIAVDAGVHISKERED